jgi:hypothetical protein
MTERLLSSLPAELRIASTWDGAPLPEVERTRLRLRLTARELLVAVAAPFHGDPPPPGPPGPTPRLWEHEVVELFVAGDAPAGSEARYTEIELSPWGHHLVLRLEGIRNVVADRLPLTLRTCRRGGRWLAAARLDRELLPPPPWRANAFAIHGEGQARRFLAVTALPGRQPDFHQPDRFPPLALGGAG